MRIACVHIPQLSLQCATRVDPSLRGAAVAVVGSGSLATGVRERSFLPAALTSPVVLACSRAAWGHGVRLGMTAAAARGLSGDLRIVQAEPQLERETVRAIADALLGASPTVDAGGRIGAGGAHLAMYIEVPAKTRGQGFGERVIEILESLGLAGRVGIADDRFTAWVAAADGHHGDGPEHAVVTVPRGGSAAFLAPRPLALLSITPEVQHMLEALGVRTLGQFAALPAPSMGRPVDRQAGGDFQALARGDSGTQLRPYAPEAAIREDIALDGPAAGLGGLSAIAALAQRLVLRLGGRERLAGALEVTAIAPGGAERVLPVFLGHATANADEMADGGPTIGRLRAVVSGEVIAGEIAATVREPVQTPAHDEHVTPLSVVLSSTGTGDLFDRHWSPTGEAALRRDVHRRTRRGKQRRRLVPTAVQPRLFGSLP
jgi:hypothetical protein